MKKAMVTGGGGFVGLGIVRQLAARGVETAVVGRNSYPEAEKLGARVYQGDIRDRDFLRRAFQGCDTVFHTAAKAGIWGRAKEYQEINVRGTENVMAAARNNNVAVMVYTSTPSVVFNGKDLGGVDETVPYAEKFLCHYALTKAMAEKMVLAANSEAFRTCALRPHLIWGPGDPHLVPRLLDRGRRGMLKQVGDGRNLVDITYIDNAVDAHLLAADKLWNSASAAGQAYFISQGEPVNLWNWINELFARVNIPLVSRRVSFDKAYFAGNLLEGLYYWLNMEKEPRMTRFLAEQLAKSHWFSIARARQDLAYSPRISTAEGMNRLLAWIKDSG